MNRQEQANVLARMTNRDHAGRHWTEQGYPDAVLGELESLGLIAIDRPIHDATGLIYFEEYHTLRVTEAGVKLVEAIGYEEEVPGEPETA